DVPRLGRARAERIVARGALLLRRARERERLARRDDLHEAAEPAHARVLLDAEAPFGVGHEELLADLLLHLVERRGVELHAHERAIEIGEVARLEREERGAIAGLERARERELDERLERLASLDERRAARVRAHIARQIRDAHAGERLLEARE